MTAKISSRFSGGPKRTVELLVAPRGSIKYSLDGSEPRDGTAYAGPIAIDDGEILVRAFAEAEALEAHKDFKFPARGKAGVQIDPVKPAKFQAKGPARSLDSRSATFAGLSDAKERSVTFEGVVLTVGQGAKSISVTVGEIAVQPAVIEELLVKVLAQFPADVPVTMNFRRASFQSGHDLEEFARKLGIVLRPDNVEQQ